jgi:hypothetical protein
MLESLMLEQQEEFPFFELKWKPKGTQKEDKDNSRGDGFDFLSESIRNSVR